MSRSLLKKVVRDIKSNLGANIAAVTMVTIALFVLTFFVNLNQILELSLDEFYKNTDFPDAFAQVISAPESAVNQIAKIEGVVAVEGRKIEDALIVEEDTDAADYPILRLTGSNFEISKFVLLEGKMGTSIGEIVLDSKFAKEKNFQVGDKIPLISNGKTHQVKIVGLGVGPENVYAVKSERDFFPGTGKFGTAYTSLETVSYISGKSGMNNIAMSFHDGITFDQLEYRIQRVLESYQLMRLYSKDDQYSNKTMTMEINSLRGMSKGMPAVFLAISLAIEYFIIKRMVEMQRGQIGLMKAMGFSDFQVLFQYIIYSTIIGAIGGFLGVGLGVVASGSMIELYREYFNMPFVAIGIGKGYYSSAFVILLCVITGYMGGRGSLYLEPSEAMRPKEPPIFTSKWKFEDMKIVKQVFSVNQRLGIRNLWRSFGRGVFIIIGISLAVSVCAAPWSLYSQVFSMIYQQYTQVETYDLKINTQYFVDPKLLLQELRGNGVFAAEPIIEMPISLRKENVEKKFLATGITKNSTLYKLKDDSGLRINLRENQIYLQKSMAEDLHVKVGDSLMVKSGQLEDGKEFRIVVAGLITQLVSGNAYLELNQLAKIVDSKGSVNGVLFQGTPEKLAAIHQKYHGAPNVSTISDPVKLLMEITNYLGLMIMLIMYIGVIGVVTGLAIIYSSFTMMISERESEITTLMVVGFDDQQITNIMGFEQWILTAIGIILGFPVASLIKKSVTLLVGTDMFYIPEELGFFPYIAGCLVVIIAVILGHLASKRKISRLNPVDALKYRE